MTKQNEAAPTEAPALKLLGRDAILAADDLSYEIVDVPEWGGQVRVKSMTSAERDSYENSCLVTEGKTSRYSLADVRAKLCSRSIVDEKGNRLFTDTEIHILGGKSAAALDRVFAVASRLSKLNKADIEQLAGELKNAPTAAP